MTNRRKDKNIERITRRITLSYLSDILHAVVMFLGILAILGCVLTEKDIEIGNIGWSFVFLSFAGSILYVSIAGERRRAELRHLKARLRRIRSSRVVWENGIGKLKVW